MPCQTLLYGDLDGEVGKREWFQESITTPRPVRAALVSNKEFAQMVPKPFIFTEEA